MRQVPVNMQLKACAGVNRSSGKGPHFSAFAGLKTDDHPQCGGVIPLRALKRYWGFKVARMTRI